jgi:hypothetical protein
MKSELSGRFEEMIIEMMKKIKKLYEKELSDDVSGIGKNERNIIEILCNKKNSEIIKIRDEYESIYRS